MYHRHRSAVTVGGGCRRCQSTQADGFAARGSSDPVQVFFCLSSGTQIRPAAGIREQGACARVWILSKLESGLENKSDEIWLSANLSPVYADRLDNSLALPFERH